LTLSTGRTTSAIARLGRNWNQVYLRAGYIAKVKCAVREKQKREKCKMNPSESYTIPFIVQQCNKK